MKDGDEANIKIDFETYGIKPKGLLLQRASDVIFKLSVFKSLECDSNESYPMKKAYEFLKRYVVCQEIIFKHYNIGTKGWVTRRYIWAFMNACFYRPLQEVIEFRDWIENAAINSELYSVVLDILHEYDIYCLQKAEIDKHIKTQRKVVATKRNKFFKDLEKRDGLFCKSCGAVENLRIDHIKPLALGGFSVLENLQLLCSFCNGRKGDRTMDYLYRRLNKSREQN